MVQANSFMNPFIYAFRVKEYGSLKSRHSFELEIVFVWIAAIPFYQGEEVPEWAVFVPGQGEWKIPNGIGHGEWKIPWWFKI